jgi:quercetin dioxygenase-like cupin family protein
MPIICSEDSTVYSVHGSTFSAYVNPGRGSEQLCAWRLEVPARQVGVTHRPDREEVLLILHGDLTVTLDGVSASARAGDAVLIGAGTDVRIDGGDDDAAAWVTTTPGLRATTSDGEVISPPWAR